MRKRSFTLIECLFVVSIITVMSTYGGLFFMQMLRTQKKAALSAARQTNLLSCMKSFRTFIRQGEEVKLTSTGFSCRDGSLTVKGRAFVHEFAAEARKGRLPGNTDCLFSIEQETGEILAVMTLTVRGERRDVSYVCREVIK